MLFAGAYGVGLMALLMAYGVDRSSPTLTVLVFALEGPGIAAAAAFVARERPGRAALAALAIGFGGSAVASGALTEPLASVPILAVTAMVAGVAVFSVYAARIRQIAPGADSLAVAAVVQIGAAAIAVPAMVLDVADRGILRGEVTAGAVTGAIVIGAGSAIGYWLMSSVLARAPASRLAVSMYLLPVVGVATAWIVLGDAPYARHVVGGALILVAVLLSERVAARP